MSKQIRESAIQSRGSAGSSNDSAMTDIAGVTDIELRIASLQADLLALKHKHHVLDMKVSSLFWLRSMLTLNHIRSFYIDPTLFISWSLQQGLAIACNHAALMHGRYIMIMVLKSRCYSFLAGYIVQFTYFSTSLANWNKKIYVKSNKRQKTFAVPNSLCSSVD